MKQYCPSMRYFDEWSEREYSTGIDVLQKGLFQEGNILHQMDELLCSLSLLRVFIIH